MYGIFLFNFLPDNSRSVLRGVVKALGMQMRVMDVHIVQLVINVFANWYFPFYLGMGLWGIWIAKTITDTFLFLAYVLKIYLENWDKVAKESVERQIRDKELILAALQKGKQKLFLEKEIESKWNLGN